LNKQLFSLNTSKTYLNTSGKIGIGRLVLSFEKKKFELQNMSALPIFSSTHTQARMEKEGYVEEVKRLS